MLSTHFIASYQAYNIVRTSAGDFVKQAGRIGSDAATGIYYLQIFDSKTLPPNGSAVIMADQPYPSLDDWTLIDSQILNHTTGTPTLWDIDATDGRASLGIPFARGLVWCISTTEDTLTLAGSVARATTETL